MPIYAELCCLAWRTTHLRDFLFMRSASDGHVWSATGEGGQDCREKVRSSANSTVSRLACISESHGRLRMAQTSGDLTCKMKSTITLLPAEGTAYRGNGSDNVDAALLTASIACKALVPCQEISLGQINLVGILKVGSQSVTYKHDGFIACQRWQAPKELL